MTTGTSRWFTSAREKRLWFLTGLVTTTVLSTLGLAGTWAGALGDPDLNAATFVLGFALIIVAVATQGLDRVMWRTQLFALVGVIAVYVLLLTRLTSVAERSHLMEYGVVAILMHAALMERSGAGRVRRPALVAVSATAVLGIVDELIQLVIPERVFDPVDILFNVIAAFLAVSGAVVLGWARTRRTRIHPSEGG